MVTADGSIDCMDAPGKQEEIVTFLHFAETVAALRILANGGNFVLKMFTFFEADSICLLFLLNNCFDHVHVFKPVTSKQGNSEVYLISIGFQKNEFLNNYLDVMSKHVNSIDSNLMFSSQHVPIDFIDQVAACALCFMEYQVDAIETNIRSFQSKRDSKGNHRQCINEKQISIENIHDLRNAIKREYFRIYAVDSIDENLKLVHGTSAALVQNMNVPIYSYGGSYSDRKIFINKSEKEKIIALRKELNVLQKSTVLLCRIKVTQLDVPANTDNAVSKAIYWGKPIESVVSSKFILVQYLRLMLEIKRNSQKTSDVTETVLTSSLLNGIDGVLNINILAYNQNISYDKLEKDIFKRIIEFTINPAICSIRIENYLLLTHFSVGLLYALGQRVFKNIYLTHEGNIMLSGSRENAANYVFDLYKLLGNIEQEAHSDKTVLNIIKINCLRNESFHNTILSYNNNLCLKYCRMWLDL